MRPDEPYPRLTKAFADLAKAALAARGALVEHPDYAHRPVRCEKAEMDAKYPMPARWREHAGDWRKGCGVGLTDEYCDLDSAETNSYAYLSGYRAGRAQALGTAGDPEANLTLREQEARQVGYHDAERGAPCASMYPTHAENEAYREGYAMGKPAWKA